MEQLLKDFEKLHHTFKTTTPNHEHKIHRYLDMIEIYMVKINQRLDELRRRNVSTERT